MVITIIGYVLTPLWIIAWYEVGKKHDYPRNNQEWKRLIVLVFVVVLYFYGFESRADPDTGISPEFDLDFYIKILVPTIVSFFTGLYFSKKNQEDIANPDVNA